MLRPEINPAPSLKPRPSTHTHAETRGVGHEGVQVELGGVLVAVRPGSQLQTHLLQLAAGPGEPGSLVPVCDGSEDRGRGTNIRG